MNAKILGKRIKEYRQKNSISQRELAERLFVSDKTISRWELGNGLPDIELLPKIAEVLGISIDELVGIENLSGDLGQAADLEKIRAELEKRERLFEQKEHQARVEAENRRTKIKRIAIIASVVTAVVLIFALVLSIVIKPKYNLTLLGIVTADGRSDCRLEEGDALPELALGGKTLLGLVDRDYNYYSVDGFVMPNGDLTLRPLFMEDMPLFAGSDSDANGMLVAPHVITADGIPATSYVFEAGSVKGSSIQSRPVTDSGEIENINVYLPSLGERFILLSVTNRSSQDVSIKYRVENFSDHQGGMDYYTPSFSIKANSTVFVPVYFKNNTNYGIFEGCDHFVILDQDIESRVELEIFGYVYLADELSGIEIDKESYKYSYLEGEKIDLSGMVVNGLLVNGSSTGKIRICNYQCNLEEEIYTENMNGGIVSFAEYSAEIFLSNPFYNKIAFAPAQNIESINESGGAEYISAEYLNLGGRNPATRFTISGGATAGMEVEAWINREIEFSMMHGINFRIPTLAGSVKYIELFVTNEGEEEISFRYYAENYGDKGGVDINIAPGESKTVYFEVDPGRSIGCNYAFKLLSDVTTTTSIVINGFFGSMDEVSEIRLYKQPDRLTFAVGESFSTEGLVIKPVCTEELGDLYNDVVISNYTTNFDGYTFTAEDVGIKVVTVSFGEHTVSYEIEVVSDITD